MTHIMLDLETWGIKPGSAIRSVGAVMFDPKSDFISPDHFYRNITDQSCEDMGLTKSEETVKWWSTRDAVAQAVFSEDPRPFKDVMWDFTKWFRSQRGQHVWAQGSNFDPIIWESACEKFSHEVPWRFFYTRDTRTAYDIAGFDSKNHPREGTYHNALDDAIHQVRCVQRAYAIIRGAA